MAMLVEEELQQWRIGMNWCYLEVVSILTKVPNHGDVVAISLVITLPLLNHSQLSDNTNPFITTLAAILLP